MPKPKPWSHTALDVFVNCPKRYYEERVVQSVKETPSEQMIWGNEVHKHFELRIKDGTPLPIDLAGHEPYLAKQAALPGIVRAEEKIALDLSGQPCGFFDANVWYRGVIDLSNVNGAYAKVVDHKTGKQHAKFGQLKLFALWIFARYPDVQTVDVRFYWTQSKMETGECYTRPMIPALWAHFLPDLIQYRDAYKHDIWQPRPSGLCYGWCPVKSCEFWKPKRVR